eukprot:1082793-Prorocentrum_minimum.AAC.1
MVRIWAESMCDAGDMVCIGGETVAVERAVRPGGALGVVRAGGGAVEGGRHQGRPLHPQGVHPKPRR